MIIAKDATIELLRNKLKGTQSELNELYLDRSWQKLQGEYLTEAIWQKSVKIIGGFEYNTRYIPLYLCVTITLASIAFGLFICLRWEYSNDKTNKTNGRLLGTNV